MFSRRWLELGVVQDPRGAVRAGWGGVGLSVLLMGAFSVLFLLAPAWLMGLFATDPELVRAGTPILRMMGLVQIFDAVGLTLAGALKGAGATRIVMLTDVTTAWLLFLPGAWFFGIHLQLDEFRQVRDGGQGSDIFLVIVFH